MTATKIQSLVHLDLRKWMFPEGWGFSQCSLAYSSTVAKFIPKAYLWMILAFLSAKEFVDQELSSFLLAILSSRSLGCSSNHDYWMGFPSSLFAPVLGGAWPPPSYCLCFLAEWKLRVVGLLHWRDGFPQVRGSKNWQDLLWLVFLNHQVCHDLLVKKII